MQLIVLFAVFRQSAALAGEGDTEATLSVLVPEDDGETDAVVEPLVPMVNAVPNGCSVPVTPPPR